MKIQHYLYWLAAVCLSFYLLLVGKDLLVPLIVAVIIWYLTNVLATGFGHIPLGKRRLSRPVCFTLAVLGICGSLFLLINLISRNITDMIAAAPIYQDNLIRAIGRLFRLVGLAEPLTVRQVFETLDIRSSLTRIAVALGGVVGKTGIIVVYLILLFLEQKSFRLKFNALFSDSRKREQFAQLLSHINSDIRTYVGIKTLTSFVTAVLSYVIMAAIGLDFAGFWAILIFLFNYIPTFGSIIATIFPAVLALVQYSGFLPFVFVGGVIGGLQFLIGNVLEPRLMGNRLNLSPLVILLALALWGSIWGVTGMLLSVPIMSILMIVLTHFPQSRVAAILLSRRGQISSE